MEERLDDAINVLRNHAEPQLGLGQLPPSLGGPQMPIGYVPPQTEAAFPDPIKVERPAHNSSKFKIFSPLKLITVYIMLNMSVLYK